MEIPIHGCTMYEIPGNVSKNTVDKMAEDAPWESEYFRT